MCYIDPRHNCYEDYTSNDFTNWRWRRWSPICTLLLLLRFCLTSSKFVCHFHHPSSRSHKPRPGLPRIRRQSDDGATPRPQSGRRWRFFGAPTLSFAGMSAWSIFGAILAREMGRQRQGDRHEFDPVQALGQQICGAECGPKRDQSVLEGSGARNNK